MKSIRDRENKWFFERAPLPFQILFVFIKGDAIVLLPFLFLIILTALISFEIAIVLFALYAVFRSFGEMIYWLLCQFSDKKYRPYDFGFHKLSNKAIYILYQTIALAGLVISSAVLLHILFF